MYNSWQTSVADAHQVMTDSCCLSVQQHVIDVGCTGEFLHLLHYVLMGKLLMWLQAPLVC